MVNKINTSALFRNCVETSELEALHCSLIYLQDHLVHVVEICKILSSVRQFSSLVQNSGGCMTRLSNYASKMKNIASEW